MTKSQQAALQLIADNAGSVEAVTRLDKNLDHIHGNVENKLRELGLIVAVRAYTLNRVVDGQTFPVEIKTWALTEAGRQVLRADALK